MILNTLIAFALTLTPQGNYDGFYNYKGVAAYQQNCTSLVQKSNDNTIYYIDASLTFSCDVYYDDSESFLCQNFKFNIQASAYYLNNIASASTLDATINYSITYDWSIHYNQYYQQFDYVSFVYGVNADDELYIKSFYDEEQNGIASQELDSTFDEVSLSRNTITFNGASFFSSVENALANFHTVTETIVIQQPSTVSTASIIFQGICNIGLMPVNFFLGVLNFEVFGINIGAFVSALLTLAIVIIIVRIIFSGGNGKGKE